MGDINKKRHYSSSTGGENVMQLWQRRRAILSRGIRNKITLKGNSTLSKVPSFTDPATITGVGEYEEGMGYKIIVTQGNDTAVYHTPKALYSVFDIAGNTAYYDYIEITENTVRLYPVITCFTFTNMGTSVGGLHNDSLGVSFYHPTEMLAAGLFEIENNAALCTNFSYLETQSIIKFNTDKAGYSVDSHITFALKFADLGLDSNNSIKILKVAADNLLKNYAAEGKPMTVYVAKSSNVEYNDLTETEFGRKCMLFAKRTNGADINSNAPVSIKEI